MNISIHTFFYGNNYGALLQSLFLKTYLEKQFNVNVYFDKYQPSQFLFREEIKPIIKKNILHSYLGIKKFFKLREWKKKYIKSFPSKKFAPSDYDKNLLSIYGSDEVWNFDNPFFGFDPFFFGRSNENFKTSYAASFGNISVSNLNYDILNEIENLLKSFKFISVRDFNSQNFLKNKFNISSEIVLDPIFLIDNEFEIFTEINKKIPEKKYCLIYGKYFSKEEIKKIIELCKNKNLLILSIGYHNEWADLNILDADPFEFLKFLKFSDIIFTSMFHGIQFAVKYNKKFWYTIDPYRKNKLDFFLKFLNLENRILKPTINYDDVIDYSFINTEIQKKKIQSRKFIINIVKNFKSI